MVLKDILSISGEPGLFKFIAQGKNSIIIEHLETKKRIREKTQELLQRSVRKDDVLGRSGENTYVIGLLKCSEEVVISKLERILNGLRKIFDKEKNSIELKYSCAFSEELVKAISPDNILGIIDASDLVKLDR